MLWKNTNSAAQGKKASSRNSKLEIRIIASIWSIPLWFSPLWIYHKAFKSRGPRDTIKTFHSLGPPVKFLPLSNPRAWAFWKHYLYKILQEKKTINENSTTETESNFWESLNSFVFFHLGYSSFTVTWWKQLQLVGHTNRTCILRSIFQNKLFS